MISSLIMAALLPACFSCSNLFKLSHNSLGLDDNHLVSDSLRDPAMIAGDLSKPIGDLSLALLLPYFFITVHFPCEFIQ